MGVKDRRVLQIIKAMLQAGIMGECEVNEEGTPQGGIISPLLANVYLDIMDEWVNKETPFTEEGRQMYFERTKKKRMNARLDEMYSEKSANAARHNNWGPLNNFGFIMNRAYALNRDKLKCRVCGGWLVSGWLCTHRVNPYLPLSKSGGQSDFAPQGML